ncbi:hypothetical protein CES86_1964 [Brucella lupini]|uniref:Uncharacterized protein n=1 Tax=Brucella lupini TaxID=255457 RepID=A0A256GU30_9HYPH|nr:hypothetical protein CES86_1964 [Brucella lupini]
MIFRHQPNERIADFNFWYVTSFLGSHADCGYLSSGDIKTLCHPHSLSRSAARPASVML